MTDGESSPYDGPLGKLLSFRVARLQAKLNAQAARLLRENADLSLTEWRILVLIDGLDNPTIGQMARDSDFDKGQLSRGVHRLVERGLATAQTNSMDSRRMDLAMTEAGRTVFEAAAPLMRRRQQALIGALPPDEVETFYGHLQKLEAVAEREDFPG